MSNFLYYEPARDSSIDIDKVEQALSEDYGNRFILVEPDMFTSLRQQITSALDQLENAGRKPFKHRELMLADVERRRKLYGPGKKFLLTCEYGSTAYIAIAAAYVEVRFRDSCEEDVTLVQKTIENGVGARIGRHHLDRLRFPDDEEV
ncbi:MAG: hypothetical protein Aurels2KO_42650 [Aureliella sp.]